MANPVLARHVDQSRLPQVARRFGETTLAHHLVWSKVAIRWLGHEKIPPMKHRGQLVIELTFLFPELAVH